MEFIIFNTIGKQKIVIIQPEEEEEKKKDQMTKGCESKQGI